MSDVVVSVADTPALREAAFDVRRDVFVDEQDVDAALEWDDWDDDERTTHFVATVDGEAVGAARLRPVDAEDATDAVATDDDGPVDRGGSVDRIGKVERVAVLDDYRGTGVGRALMDALEAHGRERGFDEFYLHSQTTAAGFYATLGYEREGEEFEEAGIPHVKMWKPA
jgi:predicted GNAT family N-acyltransferase